MISQIPKDAFGQLNVSRGKLFLLKCVEGLANLFKFWQYPRIHNPDNEILLNGIYWVYKSRYPVTKAQRGSGLKVFFQNAQTQIGANLLPDNFEKHSLLDLRFAGDLMNASGLEYSKDWFYSQIVDLLFKGDLTIGNLESTLTLGVVEKTEIKDGEMPKINASLEQYQTLTKHAQYKYDIFHMANNHILDCGLEGFDTTHDQLESDGILYYGTNRKEEDQTRALILEKNGIKLGFIGATYSVNNRPYPDNKSYLVNLIPFHNTEPTTDLSLLKEQIQYCKRQGCDFIVLTLHWGIEFEFYPLVKQVTIAHELAESGIDLIVSHHAHVIQSFEFYQTERDTNRIVPILYGLGNLASILSSAHAVLSLLAKINIVKGTVEGTEKCYVASVDLTPVFQLEEQLEDKIRPKIEILQKYVEKIDEIEKQDFRDYIADIAKYADLVLGNRWRISSN